MFSRDCTVTSTWKVLCKACLLKSMPEQLSEQRNERANQSTAIHSIDLVRNHGGEMFKTE